MEGAATMEARRVPVAREALDALAGAAPRLGAGSTLGDALQAIVEAAAAATGAELAVARVLDRDGAWLDARAVASSSAALAAEVEGTRVPAAEVAPVEVDAADALPSAVARAGARARAEAVFVVPVLASGRVVATLELHRAYTRFDDADRALARFAAAQTGLALRAFGSDESRNGRDSSAVLLDVAGEALAAGADETRTTAQIVRVAAEATDARAGLLWEPAEEGGRAPVLVGAHGVEAGEPGMDEAAELAARALREPAPVGLAAARLPRGTSLAASIQLGQPPLGILQLLFPDDAPPSESDLAAVAAFSVRAAHALRAGERSREVELELERTRALVAVVGQAISRLSLAHTLETAVERIGDLLGVDRVAVYLREQGRLFAAADRGLAARHVVVAERLLELALGPLRARGVVHVPDSASDARLEDIQDAADEAGIEAAAAVPLRASDDVIGLLALYPSRGRDLTENESALLVSLAAQLAVAVQNAQLHEHAKNLGTELEAALTAERQSTRQLRALYEVSREFAQSLSLEMTLDVLARSVVELLGVDAAVIRMPDERGDVLEPRALHVADVRLADAVRTMLARPEPIRTAATRLLFRSGEPLLLDAERAAAHGGVFELLVPFLEKGSTAAVLPISTPAEVLASLTLLSLDPDRPITDDTIRIALGIAAQAALAIDNARLYQQQKDFSDTMQRSLLPRARPAVPGLEIGDVYESSARVDVGGDVYDFMQLDDGRLAVVLGDVTGHGIDAAADMAMAKFTFRALAREHPAPGEFLAHANDVVAGEIALGKFITMAYVAVDPSRDEVVCAGAGHPSPRFVAADGTVTELPVGGLALGIVPHQTYDEVCEPFAPGSLVCLYTDGVVEARQGLELFGFDRLDETLARGRQLPAQELAYAVLAACREWAGGELTDDVAIVVIKRTS